MSVKVLAEEYSVSALTQIADAAEHHAALIRAVDKPWRLSEEQRNAIHAFTKLAAGCREVIAMGKDK